MSAEVALEQAVEREQGCVFEKLMVWAFGGMLAEVALEHFQFQTRMQNVQEVLRSSFLGLDGLLRQTHYHLQRVSQQQQQPKQKCKPHGS
jgi:hypothetical protein